MAVAPGLDRNAEHVGCAADRQWTSGNGLGQSPRDRFGGIDRRIAEFRQEGETADMVLVAVAQDDRVHRREPRDVRELAGRRPFANIEQKPLAAGFEEETGWPLAADP